LILLSLLLSDAQGADILTFGTNTQEWNRALGVSAIRMGCTSRPASCVAAAEVNAQTQKISSVYIATLINGTTALSDATEYSRLSLKHPIVSEVDIDDFAGVWFRLLKDVATTDARWVLRRFIDNLKSVNPSLKFGITLYENEITMPHFA
jgi:hypothetical protein